MGRKAFIDADGALIAHGFCEFTPGEGERVIDAPDNLPFALPRSLRWTGSTWEPYTPPPPVPTITRRQCRLWLLQHGLTAKDVAAAIATIQDPVAREQATIEWEDATAYHYDHPLFAQLAPKLGINPSQLPAEFRDATRL